MIIEVAAVSTLEPADIDAWSRLQGADPVFESPFFRPEYAQAVAAHRSDAFVGLVRDHGDLLGVLPHHRRGLGRGVPIGGMITDYQGLIGTAPVETDALLKGCRLGAYDFNHAPAALQMFRARSFLQASSPAIDVSEGFEAYWRDRLGAGGGELKGAERKRRKLEREIGPVRFVAEDSSSAAWDRFVAWKEESYVRQNARSVLKIRWVMDVLTTIRDRRGPQFSGMVTSVYAGDTLAAVHFGMRSATNWHWWFPTYNPELERYSPGLILLIEMAKWAPSQGIRRIDLGRGASRYKLAFANAAIPLCEGSLERGSTPVGAARALRKVAHAAAKATGSARVTDFQRRMFNRLLRAGVLPDTIQRPEREASS